MPLELGTALGIFATKKKVELQIEAALSRRVNVEVETFSSLPDPVENDGKYAWVRTSEGTKWLPGTLGGTYYAKGLYYAVNGAWESLDTPIQATQVQVDEGVSGELFVSPLTLASSSHVQKILSFANASEFPTTGKSTVLYVTRTTPAGAYIWDGSTYLRVGTPEKETIQLTDTTGRFWYIGYPSKIVRVDSESTPMTRTSTGVTNLTQEWPDRAAKQYG